MPTAGGAELPLSCCFALTGLAMSWVASDADASLAPAPPLVAAAGAVLKCRVAGAVECAPEGVADPFVEPDPPDGLGRPGCPG